MRNFLVYLAGPITGCTYAECVDWRREFAASMPAGVECLSPMRFKKHLDTGFHIADNYPQDVLCSQRGIMGRDYFDCNRADVIVANFLGATRASLGTAMELAWGFSKHTPIVCIMEPTGNIHDHAMIREAINFRVGSIGEAKGVVRAILDTENVL
jgi:nucleoside 2-deoxyribosyltransferase